MNIKILDSWLREYLNTKASAKQIGDTLSLTSVSVEKIEKLKNDYVYDIEVTTNRPDLMSVVGLAREAAASLSQTNIEAKFISPTFSVFPVNAEKSLIEIINDPKLVNRIIAVIMEVNLKEPPEYIKERLEASAIRSLNNIIDVTNYVMREVGHPAHVFDYDRLTTKKLIIRESRKGEKIITLDKKVHILQGGDIVADNGEGEIVDLLGIMGTANSVVTENTKRILYFLDNNDPHRIRRTSMNLGIRSEAAVLNEKGVDPELAMDAMLAGIKFYQKIADGELLSKIIDIYPNKPEEKEISISEEKINQIIGINISTKTSAEILSKLGFGTKLKEKNIITKVPSWRKNDINIQEDIIEEIARIYGYNKLPDILPPLTNVEFYHEEKNPFYWERRVKNALKYWGFTEVYTYSMVSEALLEGPIEEALKIANPLTEDMIYMRKTLVPSLLQTTRENEGREEVKIFELSNVYIPRKNDLPDEITMLSGVCKKPKVNFYEIKGIIEQLLKDFGIKNPEFRQIETGGLGTSVYIGKDHLGEIEILEENIADFELNFEVILKHANLKMVYKPLSKFPPIVEDVRIIIDPEITFFQIISLIKKQSNLVSDISLLDEYENKKTFRIVYQDPEKTLTNDEVSKIREKIYTALEKNLTAKIT